MNDPIIRFEDVTKRYVNDRDAHPALDAVSLTVAPGEFLGLMGQSGSGKTTLLNLVGGLDRSYQGRIEVLGQDLAGLSDSKLSRLRNNTFGFVFQSYHLMHSRTCAENVALPALFHQEPLADLEKRIDDVLRQVGLYERRGDRPSELSGGQKQRVAIARAMLLKPKLLFCDEPTGNLDQATSEELIDALRELSRADGVTLLLVTHEEHVASKCDRIIKLKSGRIVDEEEGAP